MFEIYTPKNPMSLVGSLSLALFSKFIKWCENMHIKVLKYAHNLFLLPYIIIHLRYQTFCGFEVLITMTIYYHCY